MHKQQILFSIFLFFYLTSSAQNFNCQQVGQLSYNQRLNDIWGYQHPSGTEYALVGTESGVSIVSLADPSAPAEVQFVPGGNTAWRDIKTFGNYMYISAEQVNESIIIVDLSQLPNNITTFNNFLTTPADTVFNAHNIYIDESGFLYIAGSNVGNGETLIYDLNTSPTNPIFQSVVGTEYAHDVFVRGDTVFNSEVSAGQLGIYDVSNKTNPVLLATQVSSNSFTHNAWVSDDGKTVFTTDERANSFTDAYDISDLSDIKLLDKWQPLKAEKYGIIPHNVHVYNDFLVTSHYTEGIVIVDAQDPANLILTGQYDTYTGNSQGFFGCWGAYPFLPSGLILASDIQTGLHVLQPNYQRGVRLAGTVTDASTSNPIFDVQVSFPDYLIEEYTSLSGQYKTGYYQAGQQDVRYRKLGYLPQQISVQLLNGITTIQNIALQPATPFTLNGQVLELNAPYNPIPNSHIKFIHTAGFDRRDTTCDLNGNFTFNNFLEEEYELVAGQWGYRTRGKQFYLNSVSTTPRLYLEKGYYDDFVFDYGWQVSGNRSLGAWERVEPNTSYSWSGMMPTEDLENDRGSLCFLTGVAQSRADSGQTILSSPVFDATSISDPYLSFHYWFTSFDSSFAVNNDQLEVWVDNGTDSVMLNSYSQGLYRWSDQQLFVLADHITLSANMQVHFIVNNSNSKNYQETGIDKVEIGTQSVVTNVTNHQNNDKNSVYLHAQPIPFGNFITINYTLPKNINKSELNIYNLQGQVVYSKIIDNSRNSIELNLASFTSGIYLVELQDQLLKIVKK